MIVGYLRVSTNAQDAQRQEDELKEKWDVDEWYSDIGTGSDMDRPAFSRMMDALEEIDTVVVWELSRISRSTSDLVDILEQFDEYDVELKTLDGTPDYDPENHLSRAMIQMGMIFAELEQEQIRERIQSGVDRAIENGKWVGRVPFGYTTNSNGYLVEDPVEYGVIEKTLEELMEGKSQNKVAAKFEPLSQPVLSNLLQRIEDEHELYNDFDFDRKDWMRAKHGL